MNITYSETPFEISAKTCGCEENKRKITYQLVESYHTLCIDKKAIILCEIRACEALLKNAVDEVENKIIEKELMELKYILDLLS
ncbi:MAG: hypothetical protein ABR515_07230 [Nitrososphaeraceae archaeon]